MMRLRTIAIALLTLAAASYGFVDAWARISERAAPQNFATLLGLNGFAEGRLAGAVLSATVVQDPQAVQMTFKPNAAQQSLIKDLSLSGYRREPLNVAALRNLGLLSDARGDKVRARQLMQAAHGVTRRDLWTTGWIAADAAGSGRVEQALQAYDEALRSSGSAQSAVLPVMLQGLARDIPVEPIIDLLKKQPPWQNEFWGLAPRFSDSLPNIAKVREAMFDANIAIPEAYDRTLVIELATHGHFAAAESIANQLHIGPRPERDEILHNGDFRDTHEHFEPFGWKLFFDSNLSTELDASSGQMTISTFSNGGGPAARQLIALTGSVYTVSAKFADWDRLDESALYFRLDCAEAGDHPPSRPIPADGPNFTMSFTKPERDCEHYWFIIYARPRDDREDNFIVLDNISLRPGIANR